MGDGTLSMLAVPVSTLSRAVAVRSALFSPAALFCCCQVPGSSSFISGPVISGTLGARAAGLLALPASGALPRPTNTDVSFDYTVAHDAGATIGPETKASVRVP